MAEVEVGGMEPGGDFSFSFPGVSIPRASLPHTFGADADRTEIGLCGGGGYQ